MEIFGVTLTTYQLISLTLSIISATINAAKVYQGMTAKGVAPKDALENATTLWGKAIAELASKRAGVPHPHPMTPAEQELWFKRADGSY